MNKLIAIDLDGTLLTSDYRLTATSLNILKAVKEKGAKIILSSGRPPRNILPYYRMLELDDPIIAYNGLLITNPSTPSFKRIEKRLPCALIKNVLSAYGEKMVNYLIESNDGALHLKKKEPALNPYFPFNERNLKTLDEVLAYDPYIAVFETDLKTEESIAKMAKDFGPYRLRHWNKAPYSEIYIDRCDKGWALGKLIETLKMKNDDVIAFGDGDNDESMIALAKDGFAIKGAKSELLKRLYPITEYDNDHDGVAKTLETLLLK